MPSSGSKPNKHRFCGAFLCPFGGDYIFDVQFVLRTAFLCLWGVLARRGPLLLKKKGAFICTRHFFVVPLQPELEK